MQCQQHLKVAVQPFRLPFVASSLSSHHRPRQQVPADFRRVTYDGGSSHFSYAVINFVQQRCSMVSPATSLRAC